MDKVADARHLSLFNEPGFAELNFQKDRRYYKFDYVDSDRLVGSLAGTIDEATFVSGYSAGFGGVDFVRDRERLDVVMRLVEQAVENLRSLGISTIRILAKPFHYSENEAFLHFALMQHGFRVEETRLNFYLDLRRYPSIEAYVESLRHPPRRLLLRALGAKTQWSEARSEDEWRGAYDVLAENRTRNGATLSLTLESVERLRDRFPKRIRMFTLAINGVCSAACLLYAITPIRTLVMYWGDRASARSTTEEKPLATMNLVAYRTVETGIAEGIQSIDLGPVSNGSAINYGNCVFKSTVDALPDFRYRLSRQL